MSLFRKKKFLFYNEWLSNDYCNKYVHEDSVHNVNLMHQYNYNIIHPIVIYILKSYEYYDIMYHGLILYIMFFNRY